MSRQQSATLPLEDGKAARKKKRDDVIVVTLYKRSDSRFWQAKVRIGSDKPRRLSTRTLSPAAAAQFAELAYRDAARSKRATPPRLCSINPTFFDAQNPANRPAHEPLNQTPKP